MRFLSVTELNKQLKSILNQYFFNVRVEGEVTNLVKHQSSGHYYFSLKDDESCIKCVLFKGAKAKFNCKLESNIKVKIEGNIALYSKRGEYQIICSSITKSGIGSFQYEKLKEKLKEEGYFDKKKKSLPKFPKKIALITSKTGAALYDMKSVTKKRWNLTKLTLFDTLVQGDEAKFQIIENIKLADKLNFDIIVLSRGGGSLEDLWAFNEEIVIKAIFEAKTPIVSAIGHEIDFVLSDFVADKRAATPSAAMEIILPDKDDWLLRLDELLDEINFIMKNKLSNYQNRLNALKNEIFYFRFDYLKLKVNLEDYIKLLNKFMNNILSIKIAELLNLKNINMYGSFYMYKKQNIDTLKQNLEFNYKNFLKIKIDLLISKEILDNLITYIVKSKFAELKYLKEMLDSINPRNTLKKGFVQITLNGEIKELQELKSNDCITLSNGDINMEAVIK
ncbi:exodeoxyribonuclease VII large subunit [Helicobacter sp. MIT 14-3879]|uniref:exodeoxyribonuclease VII large subunit n=1 Tax=Helicobacter sp. MIT 14-3879 TaxID=2040649 RepID=UPI000E1F29FD|nr:exodeoxyribonuclease VII large subunit [Helicobacter sp. MIT 14-3879]RDU63950.1 exodeoxyribonuclease VII large subunit [Helicobacter sp. MIT 14-3879]